MVCDVQAYAFVPCCCAAVVAQHVDTGEVLMQAFADRAAISETMQTG
jgi:phosphoribosyl-AMP cyclohydrolase